MLSKKLLLVASPGGHFVQLSLMADQLTGATFAVASTYSAKPSFIAGESYHQVTDFSRDTVYRIPQAIASCYRVLKAEKPDLVVTTGAAPGLLMVMLSRLMGIKALWIDSLANSKKLSLSGRIAKSLGINVLSQWPEVAKAEQVEYKGRVI